MIDDRRVLEPSARDVTRDVTRHKREKRATDVKDVSQCVVHCFHTDLEPIMNVGDQ